MNEYLERGGDDRDDETLLRELEREAWGPSSRIDHAETPSPQPRYDARRKPLHRFRFLHLPQLPPARPLPNPQTAEKKRKSPATDQDPWVQRRRAYLKAKGEPLDC